MRVTSTANFPVSKRIYTAFASPPVTADAAISSIALQGRSRNDPA
ncbi:hypothetical protein RHECNPAF_470043 [Rhizobium etli CNPAF512]|nr:hypothetical protein RHECNPAF_470043 [Rhizobium etli CNPAF512]